MIFNLVVFHPFVCMDCKSFVGSPLLGYMPINNAQLRTS